LDEGAGEREREPEAIVIRLWSSSINKLFIVSILLLTHEESARFFLSSKARKFWPIPKKSVMHEAAFTADEPENISQRVPLIAFKANVPLNASRWYESLLRANRSQLRGS
jgi:hypothetical protein